MLYMNKAPRKDESLSFRGAFCLTVRSLNYFPDDASSGNRDPEYRLRVGRRFRMAPSTETASHFDYAE